MKFKKLIAVVGMVGIVGAALAACGETEVSTKSASTETSQTASKETKPKKEEKKEEIYKIGDTVSINDVEITLDNPKFVNASSYESSKKGKILSIEITVENNSNEEQFIDCDDFSIYDENGVKVSSYLGFDEYPLSDTVNKGRTITGHLFYDVPEQGNYELVLAPSFVWDNAVDVKWDIKM
ncbi:DUF4352 domain-containing protein [Priestia megaterium]